MYLVSSHLDLLQLWGYNGHGLEEISWRFSEVVGYFGEDWMLHR